MFFWQIHYGVLLKNAKGLEPLTLSMIQPNFTCYFLKIGFTNLYTQTTEGWSSEDMGTGKRMKRVKGIKYMVTKGDSGW